MFLAGKINPPQWDDELMRDAAAVLTLFETSLRGAGSKRNVHEMSRGMRAARGDHGIS